MNERVIQEARRNRPRLEPRAGVSARRYLRVAPTKQMLPMRICAEAEAMYSQLNSVLRRRMLKMELPSRGLARTVTPGRSSRRWPWLTQKPMVSTLTIQRKAVWARNPKKTRTTQMKTVKLRRMALAMAQRWKVMLALWAMMAPMTKLASAIESAWQGAPKM